MACTSVQKRTSTQLFLSLCGGLLAIAVSPAFAQSQSTDDEIEFLIDSVGRDGCRFVRNDRAYRGREAREHLRSKWRLNAHLVSSAEDFIQKLASTSATTGRPYQVNCRGGQSQVAGQWFLELLQDQRQISSPPVEPLTPAEPAFIEAPEDSAAQSADSADATTSAATVNRGSIQRRPVN